MSELTDNDTKTIKLIVDETSDAVVRKLTSTIYYPNNTDSFDCVLDKIKAEIEEAYNDRPSGYNHTQRIELFCKVIEIIDKYKTEEKENNE